MKVRRVKRSSRPRGRTSNRISGARTQHLDTSLAWRATSPVRNNTHASRTSVNPLRAWGDLKEMRNASPRHRSEPQLASLGIAVLVGEGFVGAALATFQLLTERHSPVRDDPAEPPQVSPSSQPGTTAPGQTDAQLERCRLQPAAHERGRGRKRRSPLSRRFRKTR